VIKSPGVCCVTPVIVAVTELKLPLTPEPIAKLPEASSTYNLLSTLNLKRAVISPEVINSPFANAIDEFDMNNV